jgi:YHS domain-containing protein
MKRANFFLAILAVILISACSAEKKYDATIPEEITASESPFTHLPASSLVADNTAQEEKTTMTAEGLDKELVCMVNNAYMGKKQFPVEFGNKLYYGCCEMCVNTIQNEASVRVAKDPVSGKEVDKSEAFIALEPGNPYGGVLYFESEANYKKYSNI